MTDKTEFIEITNLKEKQTLLIQILKQFHDICEQNGLVYNIFGGTMLGAVRHKGIIPWDDDIDITMPRSDYNRFIMLIKEEYSQILNIHVYPDENYIYPYAKLGMKGTILYENAVKEKYSKLSLSIDIFPNDGYPTDETIFDKYDKCEKAIIACTYNLPVSRNPIKRTYSCLKSTCVSMIGVKYFLKKQIDMISRNRIEDSEYMILQGAGWGKRGKIRKEKYYDRVLYEFEGIKVWGIRDYDIHLTNLYGDYMALPPLESRVAPHASRLFIDRTVYDRLLRG